MGMYHVEVIEVLNFLLVALWTGIDDCVIDHRYTRAESTRLTAQSATVHALLKWQVSPNG